MNYRTSLLTFVLLLVPAGIAIGQPKKEKSRPILRLDADGPYAHVTSLTFSPDGRTLYAGGFDKVVRVWRWNPASGKFEHNHQAKDSILRVPISAGLQGAINSLAVSDDGQWLAVGGFGASPELVGIGLSGRLFPTAGVESEKLKLDQGVIYVFHTATGKAKRLRGHTGNITDLSFSPGRNASPVLFSMATARRNIDAAESDEKVSEVIAWDVAKEKPIAKLPDQVYLKNLPPKLHGIPPIPGEASPRVALALGDGKLRLWDVRQPDADTAKISDGSFNNVIAYSSDEDTGNPVIYTASWGQKKNTGYVTSWDVGNTQPKATFFSMRPYKNGPVTYVYQPRGLAVSTKYITAAVKDRNDKSGKFGPGHVHLWMINQETRKTANFISLWPDSGRAPVIATDRGGRFVAVAGNGASQIYVYRADDLATKTKPEAQILRSDGRPVFKVVFCEKTINNKKHFGLRIDHDAAGNDQTVFDITANELVQNVAGWNVVAPSNEGWQHRGSTLSVSVNGPGFNQVDLNWPKGNGGAPPRAVTSYQLSDQSPVNIPLLAVATSDVETSESAIEIYHAGTGEQIRRFLGHVGKIRSLAFSADGRLLASASEDHTVAVWSLTNLDEVYKKHGRLPGFAVAMSDKNQLVLKDFRGIVDNSDVAAGLQKGMVIDGVENLKMKIVKPASPAELYDRFWITKPKSVLKLQIGNQFVKVQAGQGVDVQPPLFQLFITKNGKQQKLEWAAWTPMGDFDLSHKNVGQVLGWHFNTGNPAQPTSYASLSQYQPKDFELFLPGIVKYLVKHGNRMDARKDITGDGKPKPAPKMIGELPEFVRAPKMEIDVFIQNYQPKKADSIELQKLNANNVWTPYQKFEATNHLDAEVKLPAESAIHRFRFVLNAEKNHVFDVQQVRYQPLAPEFSDMGNAYVVVKQKDHEMKATVTPSSVPALVVLEHYHRGEVVKRYKFRVTKKEKIQQKVTLEKGVNTFAWTAVNENALAQYDDHEKAETKGFAVVFEETVPPKITLQSVQPFWQNGALKKIDLKDSNQKWIVVETPSIRVAGEITAPKKLKSAIWRFGKGKPETKLKHLDVTKKKFDFQEEIPIEPGDQEIEFEVTSNDNKKVTKTLHVRFQPKLPSVKFEGPPEESTVKNQFAVRGTLRPATITPRKPFDLTLTLVRDGVKGETIKVPSNATAFQFKPVMLEPGANSFQVEMAYLSRKTTSNQSLVRTYVRPPEITELKIEQPNKKVATGTLTAKIKSATPLDIGRTVVKIKTELHYPKKDTITVEKLKKEMDVWLMKIERLPLNEGGNDVELTVANAETTSEAKTANINVPIAPKHPQIVRTSGIEDQIMITSRTMDFPFKIMSERPLELVQVMVDGEVVHEYDKKAIAKAFSNQKGRDDYEFKIPLKFGRDKKRVALSVEARNEGGGFATTIANPIAVEIKLPPPGVQIAKVEALDAQNKWVTVTPGKDNVFDKLPKGRVRVHGIARWEHEADVPSTRDQSVEIYVNNFRHIPVSLTPTSVATERKFVADLLLNSKTNSVKFELPKVAVDSQDSDISQHYTMICDQPHEEKRFYPVLFAPILEGQPALGQSSMALKSQVEAALAKSKGPKNYVELTNDYYGADRFHLALLRLRSRIKAQTIQGASRAVVLFVYQGKQTVTEDDVYLWTSNTTEKNYKRESVPMSYIKDFFSRELYGAQVVFMDALPGGSVREGWLTTRLQKEDIHFAAFGRLHDGQVKSDWSRLVHELKNTLPEAKDFNQLQQRLERWSKMPPPPIFDQYVPKELKIHFTS